ncbi:MAG: hypothetical protein ACFFHD_03805 [Promethearchaeota archaeon]
MTNLSISSLIIDKFGITLYQKSLKFLSNKINIFYLREDPIKIRSIILDNEREYHLIIDEMKSEIYHDCPSFLIHSEREKKICIHLIKLFLIIKNQLAQKILENLKTYNLTSEDLGSKKKGKSFLLLANSCLESQNYVEALSYLNKAIINYSDKGPIIEKYLKTAIKNNLFIEFFEFLKYGYENELGDYFTKNFEVLEVGFKKFLDIIPQYSFYNVLKIIESIEIIFSFIDISFVASDINKIKNLVNSSNINNNYFSIYLIKKNYEKLVTINPNFKNIINQDKLDSLKQEVLNYFFSEIDNFCIIDKLKLLKKQFKVIGIPKELFNTKYKNYKKEIKELERKVYLKKFSFLKYLIEKNNIIKAKGEFRKKRNAYIVEHNNSNIKNPVYYYIISRIGFFGLNEQTIKSSEIGINYFIIKELFLDDLSSFQDVDYYRKQFWGENEYEIRSVNGFSLLSKNIEYSYEGEQKYSDDVMIIEWDLASKPIQGSIVNAYGSQIIIPDQNNPLFYDLNPFDLCYCKKTPIKIESIIKTVNIITKCSFKDAIKSISRGMDFIEGYYPFSLIKAVLNKEINPFQANELVITNPNRMFIPNYSHFIKAFKKFLFNFIFKHRDYIFQELKSKPKEKSHQILTLLDLTSELSGLDLPYFDIMRDIIYSNINLKDFKIRFLNEIHLYIEELLRNRDIGTTIVFDLKKLRNTSFSKYSNQILNIRKEEFESSKIYKFHDRNETDYNISEIKKTYYGHKFLNILNLEEQFTLKPEKFKKFSDFALKLNLKLNIADSFS